MVIAGICIADAENARFRLVSNLGGMEADPRRFPSDTTFHFPATA